MAPHEVVKETRLLLSYIECRTCLISDHCSSYLNLAGLLPDGKTRLL